MQLVLCKDNANRVQKLQARLGVMLRCSLSYAKILIIPNKKKIKQRVFTVFFYLFFHLLIMYAKRSRIPFRP